MTGLKMKQAKAIKEASVVQVLHETSVMLVKLTVYLFTCSFALNVRNTINCLCLKASTLEKQG